MAKPLLHPCQASKYTPQRPRHAPTQRSGQHTRHALTQRSGQRTSTFTSADAVTRVVKQLAVVKCGREDDVPVCDERHRLVPHLLLPLQCCPAAQRHSQRCASRNYVTPQQYLGTRAPCSHQQAHPHAPTGMRQRSRSVAGTTRRARASRPPEDSAAGVTAATSTATSAEFESIPSCYRCILSTPYYFVLWSAWKGALRQRLHTCTGERGRQATRRSDSGVQYW